MIQHYSVGSEGGTAQCSTLLISDVTN